MRVRTATQNDAEVEVRADPDGPLCAQIFKTRIDPFVQKLSFVRIFSGRLKKDATTAASSARKPIKTGQLFRIQGGESTPVDSAGPGQLVAIAKMEELHTGTTLGEMTLPPI